MSIDHIADCARKAGTIKVLHLVHSLNPGGVETHLLRMMQRIPRSRVAMDICCRVTRFGPLVDKFLATGAKIVSARWAHVPTTPWKVLQTGFVRRLTQILQKGEYDLLHVHIPFVSGLAAFAARRAGVPSVLTIHRSTFEPDSTFSRNWFVRSAYKFYLRQNLRISVRHAAHVAANSRAAMDRMVGPQAHGSRFSIMYSGIEHSEPASQAERADFRRSLGWEPDCPLVLNVGRFDEGKNQRGVVQIFRKVLENVPHARLVLVGDGPTRDSILQLIGQLGLTSQVRWLGTRGDVTTIMSRSDLLLFPSFTESLSAVVLEAGAAGLPIVTSRIPGMDEAVHDGISAFLHPVHDHPAMVSSVCRLLLDPALAAEVGRNGQRHVRNGFSSEAAEEQLVRLYQSLIPAPQTSGLRACG